MSAQEDVSRRTRERPSAVRQVSVLPPVAPETAPAAAGSDLVRALFHDLRQPLAALHILASTDATDTQAQLAGIREQVRWMGELVDSVLGEPGRDRVEVLDLAEIARSAMSSVPVPPRTTVSLDLVAGVTVSGRRVPLSRALLCLLDNALRAAGDGGHVELVVRRRGRWAVVSVADDGPGVGRIRQQHALGLVTVRAVLADCAGHLDLVDHVRGGAVASVTIPLATPLAFPLAIENGIG